MAQFSPPPSGFLARPPLGYIGMLERWEKKNPRCCFSSTSTSYICPSSSSISFALLLRPRFAALINQVLSFLPFLPQSVDSLACKRMKMPLSSILAFAANNEGWKGSSLSSCSVCVSDGRLFSRVCVRERSRSSSPFLT